VARIWILSPVYFDVESYRRLRGELKAVLDSLPLPPLAPRFVMVDDSGGRDPSVSEIGGAAEIIVPPFNLGHQRAIVHGLRRLSREIADDDFVVTLDGDGEDQPRDLPRLLATLQEQPGNLRRIALAARTRRRETPVFKLLYFFFKHFFLLLSGTVVRSGNYAAFHGWVARNVLFHPHFDLCYASSLLSLDLEIVRVPCERGERYAGQSKMTYGKLVSHGFRMLMPFADRIAVRGLVVFAVLLLLGLAALAVAFVLLAAGARISAAALCGLGLFVLLCATSLGSSLLLFALFSQSQGLSMTRLRE
jgi:hypothetical protein